MESWLIEMGNSGMDTIDEKSHRNKGFIHKIPASLVDETAEQHYKPRTVSFGPYHCDDKNLLTTEHKDRAVLHFVKRSKRSIREYYEKLEEVVSDLQLAYTSLPPYWEENKDHFLQLMIRDGCFMLEFLALTCVNYDQTVADEYAPTDPIFSRHEILHSYRFIRRDMLLLENQLPLLVLRRLLAVHYRDEGMGEEGIDAQIRKLLGETIYTHDQIWHRRSLFIYSMADCHVLDVYRRNMLYDVEAPAEGTVAPPRSMVLLVPEIKTFWSIRQLHEAGTRIKKNISKGAVGNISFAAGTLTLPRIVVSVRTEDEFLNLMALERLQPRRLSKDMVRPINQDPYLLLYKELQDYWYKRGWRGYIVGTYFRNPWAPFSAIASFIIFILTFAQTLYTIYQYYQKT